MFVCRGFRHEHYGRDLHAVREWLYDRFEFEFLDAGQVHCVQREYVQREQRVLELQCRVHDLRRFVNSRMQVVSAGAILSQRYQCNCRIMLGLRDRVQFMQFEIGNGLPVVLGRLLFLREHMLPRHMSLRIDSRFRLSLPMRYRNSFFLHNIIVITVLIF